MKRILIIAFSFVCLFGFGQYQTSNLDFLFNGSIEPTDSTLIDSITSVGNSNYKLINVDFPINTPYLPNKSGVSLIMYGDTVPLSCLNGIGLRNYNDADTTFIQQLSKTINADSTELLPKRVKRIAHYSTATTDNNNYFDALSYATTLIVPDNYATIDLAYAAASATDTILLKSSYNIANITSSKALTYLAIGDVYWTSTSNYPLRFAANTTVKGIEYYGDGVQVMYSSSSNIINNIDNCVISGTSGSYFTNSTQTNNINNCVVTTTMQFVNGTKANVQNSRLNSTGNYIYVLTGNVTSRYNDYIDAIITPLIISGNTVYDSKYDNYTGQVTTNTLNNSTSTLTFSKSTFESDISTGSIFNLTTNTSNSKLRIDSCTFNNNSLNQSNIINLNEFDSISITNSYFNDVYGSLITATGTSGNSAIITGNIAVSDSGQSIVVQNYKSKINNNYLESEKYSRISLNTDGTLPVDSIPSEINNNTIISKDYKTNGSPLILGNENDLPSFGELNGSVIRGNLVLGPGYYGNDIGGTHGVFIAGGNNVDISYNYSSGFLLGFISKFRGLDYLNIYRYNKAFNNGTNYLVKGAKTKHYNNLSYQDTNSSHSAAFAFIEDDVYPGSYSDSCVMVNNIISSLSNLATWYALSFYTEPNDTAEYESYNNIYYHPTKSNIINVQTATYTFSEWQALGYDANSYNQDPLLNANGVPQKGSIAIGKGVNLGSTYEYGLSPNATFPNPLTIPQYSRWSIGAYVPDLPNSVIHYQNKIIIAPGNKIILFNK